MKVVKDKTLGYLYFMDQSHPLSDKKGRVWHHRHVASEKIGRLVRADEIVHHLDENRSNNDPDNLEVMTNTEHARRHAAEKGFCSVAAKCEVCGTEYTIKQSIYNQRNKQTCGRACYDASTRRFDVTADELRRLVWSMPTTAVAKQLGVSDVAVGKRCKILGIKKPPPGHHRKVTMKKFSHLRLLDFGHTTQLAGVVYVDKDAYTYIVPFPDETIELEFTDVLETSHEDWVALLRQTDLLETEIMQHAEDKTIVKAIIRKSTRQIEQGVSWNVFRRDGYACRYCGKNDVPLTVDHLVTWESGGPSIEANLVSACRKCNKVRGELPYAEWLKHTHYARVMSNLTPQQRHDNIVLLQTLDKIPLRVHQRSR